MTATTEISNISKNVGRDAGTSSAAASSPARRTARSESAHAIVATPDDADTDQTIFAVATRDALRRRAS